MSDPSTEICVVSVGSPASYVANDGPWVNNQQDLKLRLRIAGNISVTGYDFLNHDLLETYMSPQASPRVMSAVMSEFADMQDGSSKCTSYRNSYRVYNKNGAQLYSTNGFVSVPVLTHGLWT
ncbi:hypothetical protein OE749_16005 [Aestuariibacter sp. AA17]|uniref:Uncharacterized protein n=1 Tax=Fluctibacter corallii TaxID=2984329 RepID=A0ABT3ABZ1_9ALTE|nr:hypothetical protein [Aestuariibacter sp. AA17]MCV2886197.1 hypothetical protein [Aestuariibacter sp. AA17]